MTWGDLGDLAWGTLSEIRNLISITAQGHMEPGSQQETEFVVNCIAKFTTHGEFENQLIVSGCAFEGVYRAERTKPRLRSMQKSAG